MAAEPCTKLMVAACLVFLGSLVFAVFTARALYDDGSYYFVKVLQGMGFTEMVYSRDYADYFYQLPVVIAMKLGVMDMDKLQVAFGIGCFMAWPMAMGMCLWLAPRHFWLVVLACGAGYLNAAFSAVAEHVVAHAFFWPVVFAIVFVRPLTPVAGAMLLVSAAILVRSYESMLFLGPLLTLMAYRRAAGEPQPWARIVFLVAMVMLLVSAPIALEGTLHPGHGSNANSFKSGILSILADPGWTILWTLVWVGLMAACWWPQARAWLAHPVSRVVLGGVIVLWGAWPMLMPSHLDVYKQYEARFLDLGVPLVLLGVALIVQHRPDWVERQRREWVNLSAGLLLAQSLWHIGATEQWRTYLNVLRDLMAQNRGIVKLMDTPYGPNPAVGRQATQFVWEMDLLNMCIEIGPRHVKSLVLANDLIDGETINRNLRGEFKPGALPHLEPYGVDYSEYIAAVTNSPILEEWKPGKAAK